MKAKRIIIFIAILVVLAFVLTVRHLSRETQDRAGETSGKSAHATEEDHEGHDHEAGKVHDMANEGDTHEIHGDEGIAKLSEEERKEFGIELATAGPGKLQLQLSFPGEISINEDRLAHIVPRVPGVVREVRKSLGDMVDEGDVMAVIESRELANIKAEYLAARERVNLSQANFTREERLWKKKITPEQEYLDAKQALAEALIEERSAEQKLHALGFSDEYLKVLPEHPDESFTRYEITAPFKGTVVEKHITLGEKLGNDTDVFTIADLSDVWVNLTVYQKDLGSVRVGHLVVVRADQIDVEESGTIDYVSPIVDESTRTATALVVLDNTSGLWWPGMFVTGQADVHEVEANVVVPRSALQTIEGQNAVFVLTREGFESRPVKTGQADREQMEILSGLNPGEQYAVKSGFTLKAEMEKGSSGGSHAH